LASLTALIHQHTIAQQLSVTVVHQQFVIRNQINQANV